MSFDRAKFGLDVSQTHELVKTDAETIVHPEEFTTAGVDLEESLQQIQVAQRSLVALERLQCSVESFAGTPMTQRSAEWFHHAYAQATAGLEGFTNELPSVEAFVHHQDTDVMRSVSLESIGSTVKRAIEIVLGLLKRLFWRYQRMMQILSPNLRRLQATRFRAELLSRQIAGRFPQVDEIRLGRHAKWLSTELKPPSNGGELTSNLNELEYQLNLIAGRYLDNISRIKDQYIQQLSRPVEDTEDAQERLKVVQDAVQKYGPAGLASEFRSLKRITDPRYPSGTTVAGPPLPGGRSIIVSGDPEVSGIAHKVDFTRLHPAAIKDYSDSMMRTLLPQEIRECLRLIGKLLGHIESALVGGRAVDLRRMADAVDRLSSKLESDYTGRQGDVAELVSYGASISNWLASPYLPLLSMTVSVCNSAVDALVQHIHSYGVGGESEGA